MIEVDILIQYFNYAFIATVAFYALIGFFRGTYKSLYYLIATFVIFFGGWLARGPIINFLSTYDLSKLNISLEGVPLKNLNQFVEDMIKVKFPESNTLMVQDTLFREFIFGVVTMVLQFVYFLLLVVLAFTVFKFIFDIIWFIIKPRKKIVVGKKVKPKKGFISRLGGMGLGAVKGAFYSLLIFFPIAGIASIGNSIGEAINAPQNMSYQLVVINDTITIVEDENNNNNNNGLFNDELEEALNILGAYDKSIAGKVLGTFDIDTKVFDEILTIKVKNANIRLRKELEIAAGVLGKIRQKSGNMPLEDAIIKILTEDPDFFQDIVDDLSKLELVKIAIPIGIEVGLLLEDENGETLLDKMPESVTIDFEAIYDIDYQEDFKKIGYTFIDVASLIDLKNPESEIDFLNFDPEVVERIFNNIGDLDIVNEFAPIAISYLVTTDMIQQSLQELDLTVEDLGFDEVESWGNEIKTIGQIYKAFLEMQISSFDKEGLVYVTEEKINKFANAVFTSTIIKNAVPILVNSLSKEFIPEEYQEVLVIDTSIFDKEEFGAILNATVVIIKSDILSGDQETLFNLSDDTINDLAKYLSKSKFITKNLNSLIDIMLSEVEFLGSEVELEKIAEDDWTELELRSIFTTVKVLGNAGVENLQDLSDENIELLATNMTSSKFIRKNLNNIFDVLLSQVELVGKDVTIELLEDDEWSATELTSIFKSVRLITKVGADNLLNLNDDQIDELSYNLANSLLVTRNLELIIEQALSGVDFGEDIEIGKFEHWDDPEASEKELKAVFTSARIISEKGSDADALLDLTDNEMDTLLSSEIITKTLVNILEVYSQEGRELEFLIGVDNENITWLDEQFGKTGFVVEGNTLIITPVPKATKYNIYVNEEKIAATRHLKYDLSDVDLDEATIEVEAIFEGELRKIFVALGSVTETMEEGFTIDTLSSLTDEEIENIMISDILVLSIVNQLEILDNDEESVITIPEGDLKSPDENVKLAAWKNNYILDDDGNLTYTGEGKLQYQKGELERSLDALQIVLNGESVEDIDIGNILNKENQEIVLQSLVVEETLITQIEKNASEPNSQIVIPNNIKNDRSLWKGEQGELRNLLNSLSYILGENAKLEDIKFDLDAILDNQDEILKSDVVVEIAITKIEEQESVHIPVGSGYGLLNLDDRNPWKNIYKLDQNGKYVYDENDKIVVNKKGELARLLDALDLIIEADPITGEKNFENIQFNFNALFDSENQDKILSSLVVSETAVHIVYDTSATNDNIYIPLGYVNALNDNSEYNRDRWFNRVVDGKLIKGELAHLLDAANIILGDEGDFEEIEYDLDIAFDDDKQEILLKSYVISESIVNKIYDIESDGYLSIPLGYVNPRNSLYRDKWFSVYENEEIKETREIVHLLEAAELLLTKDDENGENSSKLETLDFDLSAAFDDIKQKEILKSLVISETIVQKIFEEEKNGSLNIPLKYLEDSESLDRETWFNKYQDGELVAKKEISYLLEAAELLLEEGSSFENIQFDLSAAFDEVKQEEILKSLVISETIVHKIFEEEENGFISVPVKYVNPKNSEDREKWFNIYEGETLIQRNEIARFLNSAKLLLGEDAEFKDFDFDLNAAFDDDKQKEILKSYVISETIVQKIFEEEKNNSLNVPLKYLEDSESLDREKWFNEYNDNGELIAKKEIAHFLEAAERLLGENANFGEITFDLSAAFDRTKQDEILKSLVISETIVQKIFEEEKNGSLHIPLNYVEDSESLDREKWYNKYNDEVLVERNEIANLLEAARLLLGDDATFANMTFDLSAAFDEVKQDTILKSYVISETIVQKVFEEANLNGILEIPSTNYLNALEDGDRSKWFNQYNEGELVKRNEIANLLNAAKVITNGGNFANINFEIDVLFDKTKQTTVLKSYVFSETIVKKIIEEDANVINVPLNDLQGRSMSNSDDRSPWYNVYQWNTTNKEYELIKQGEIARMLDAVDAILDEGGTFATMDFGLEKIFDDDIQEIVLRSLVLSETIVAKILDNKDAIHSVPDVDLKNRSLVDDENREAWYNQYDDENNLIEVNELGKFLKGIKLILGGKDYTDLGEIVIDDILALELNVNHDEDFNLISSDFATILDSVVLEHIIAPLAAEIADNIEGLNEPDDGYKWYKKEIITDYDPDTFDEQSYDLQSFLESLYIMSQAGINYNDLGSTNLKELTDDTIEDFAKAMVVSRVFKESIASIFNNIIGYEFFNQADYSDPKTRKEAYNILVAQINVIKMIL